LLAKKKKTLGEKTMLLPTQSIRCVDSREDKKAMGANFDHPHLNETRKKEKWYRLFTGRLRRNQGGKV